MNFSSLYLNTRWSICFVSSNIWTFSLPIDDTSQSSKLGSVSYNQTNQWIRQFVGVTCIILRTRIPAVLVILIILKSRPRQQIRAASIFLMLFVTIQTSNKKAIINACWRSLLERYSVGNRHKISTSWITSAFSSPWGWCGLSRLFFNTSTCSALQCTIGRSRSTSDKYFVGTCSWGFSRKCRMIAFKRILMA